MKCFYLNLFTILTAVTFVPIPSYATMNRIKCIDGFLGSPSNTANCYAGSYVFYPLHTALSTAVSTDKKGTLTYGRSPNIAHVKCSQNPSNHTLVKWIPLPEQNAYCCGSATWCKQPWGKEKLPKQRI